MLRSVRVCVVSDSPILETALGATLRAAGFSPTITSCSPQSAADQELLGHDLAVVDCDTTQPFRESIAACHAVAPSLPIVLVSGAIDHAAVRPFMSQGVCDYTTADQLERIVTRLERELFGDAQDRAKDTLLENARRTERLYASVLNQMSDGVVVADMTGKFILFNTAGEKLLATGAVDGPPSNWADAYGVFLPDQVTPCPAEQLPLVRALGGEEVRAFEIFVRNPRLPNGAALSVNAVPLRDDSAAVIGGIATLRDISALNLARGELAASQLALVRAQKMEALGRLAGGIAHDFNNLLAVIGPYCEMLGEDHMSDAAMQADLNEIRHATQRATDLVRQLLAFSRRDVPTRRSVDPAELIAEFEPMLRHVTRDSITLKIQAWSKGQVSADAGQLEQVIMNLVVNARDAMSDGGEAVVETTDVILDEAAITLIGASIRPGPYVQISVNDTGIGMDEVTRGKIFEPFFTTKPVGKGTGLGLATVAAIVSAHDGAVYVKSTVGRGSSFCVLLPHVASKPEKRQVSAKLPLLRGTSETVLVVEHEPAVRDVIQRVLARYGYRAIIARSAGEALLLAERYVGPISLLIADLSLPSMGGIELATRIRALHREVVVMLTTGDVSIRPDDVEHPLLKKPFTVELLLRTIRHVIDRSAVDGDVGRS